MLAWSTAPVYRILGPLTAGASAPPGGQHARVLGVLLLRLGSVVPTAELSRWALGPDRVGEVAQVHVLVARLRRMLRQRSLPGGVTSGTGGYVFGGDRALLDAGRFDALLDAAQSQLDTDPVEARRLVTAASGLWQGELLAGLDLDGHPAAARLAERRLAALELGFIADLTLGQTASLPDMLDAHRRFPDCERLTVIAMTSLFLAGRQTEAIALYQRARQHLGARTGLEPGPDLRNAEAAVLRHDVQLVLTECLGIPESRLTTTAVLKQASRGTLSGTGVDRWRSAPRFLTSFVGRTGLVERTIKRSATPGLATFVGPGGVGKTRLVCESIGRRSSVDTRPVWFCELAALDDGTDGGGEDGSAPDRDGLARLVARAVGARLEPGRSPIGSVVAWLAETEGVLVLDSCETQINGASDLASALVVSCPSLTILATSRVPLGVAGEQVVEVPPLEVGGAASELYCHRAIDVDPGFSLEVDDLDAIIELCARLDGLPLAIELAASRSRTAGPRELLSHLDHAPLDLLRSRAPGTSMTRHRSLDATIDWSYRLLAPEQQQVLRRLGVFSGPVGIDDLLAVCDDGIDRPVLLDRLSELVERSMVATARQDECTHYRLLDTVRAFTVDRASSLGELGAVRRRHAEYYAGLLDRLRAALRGPDEGAAAVQLDRIWPEVRAAVVWSARSAQVDLAVRLVAGLGFEAVFRERAEVVVWADDVLALPGVLEQPGADEVLGTAGLADWGYGQFDRGLERSEKAVALHRQRGTRFTPDVAAALPLHLSLRGDLPRAIGVLRAHALEAERDDVRFAQVHTRTCEAMTLGFAGSSDADAALADAEELAARLGCPLLQAIAAFTRVIVVLDRRAEEAVAHARRCLALAASVGATWFQTAGTNYLVAALARSSSPHDAIEPLRAALERQLNGGTVQSVANTIRNTVALLDRVDRAERAVELIGWLDVNRPSIPGTPGMRSHPAALAARLRNEMGDTSFETLRLDGANLSMRQVISAALTEVARLNVSPGATGGRGRR